MGCANSRTIWSLKARRMLLILASLELAPVEDAMCMHQQSLSLIQIISTVHT